MPSAGGKEHDSFNTSERTASPQFPERERSSALSPGEGGGQVGSSSTKTPTHLLPNFTKYSTVCSCTFTHPHYPTSADKQKASLSNWVSPEAR